jgi:hypothetical protein
MQLFPRLPRALATRLAHERAKLGIDELRELAELSHPSVSFSPTGGARISENTLGVLAEAVRSLAGECGYPEPRSVAAKDQFDGRLGKLLHRDAGLTASEASRDEVWNFLGCVLLPDVVRWRSSGDATPIKNFLGTDRGIDNTFGRCWWAAELLYDNLSPDDSYGLLVALGVDETVGFSRRARAITNRRVAAGLARTVVAIHAAGFEGPRLELMRDAMKRFLRLGSFVAFEFLTDDELELGMWTLVDASARYLTATADYRYTPPPRPVIAPSKPTSLPRWTSKGAEPLAAPASADADLSSLLAEIEVDSRGPNRFAIVKNWFGDLFGIEPSDVSIKRLSDPKNYRNRIGEALRQRPAVAVLLGTSDTTNIEDAIAERLHLSPGSTVLLCVQSSLESDWRVSFIYTSQGVADRLGSARAFPEARLVRLDLDTTPAHELPVEQRQLLMAELEVLPLGLGEPVAVVESTVRRVTGLTPRIKRISDAKNVGNRISEGLGTGAALLVIGVTFELFDMTVANAQEQLRELDPTYGIIIVPEDVEGCLAESPVYLGAELLEEDETAFDETDNVDTDNVDEEDLDEAPTATDQDSGATSFWDLESLDERSQMIVEHLLFQGPLQVPDAIRLAAERMREHGQLDYQRLRINGEIYSAISKVIEFGVRTGDFDRPRRGEVRAVLASPDDFTGDDWINALLSAMPRNEPMSRESVVRTVAVWAKQNIGLEYARLRPKGRIDGGVRNAIRTLLRRNILQATSRDELVLAHDTDED